MSKLGFLGFFGKVNYFLGLGFCFCVVSFFVWFVYLKDKDI